MLKGLFSLIGFIVVVAAIGYGVSWAIDNKEELPTEVGEGQSITSLVDDAQTVANDVVQNAQETMEQIDEETIDPSEVNVLVLNGGDVVGAAGDLQEVLVAKGYELTDASNANTYDHSGVTVYYQEESKNEAEAIVQLLSQESDYSEARSQTAETTEQRQSDVVIILGER